MNMPSRKIIEIGVVIGDTDSQNIIEEKNWLIKVDEPITEFITDLTSIKDA
jgi:DNA polymerase III alpha subunit (gram-positive type)